MILIVYYSWQGHTEKVATALAERIGGRLERSQLPRPEGRGLRLYLVDSSRLGG
ncbi:MAG: hypothetical protein M0P22_10635 [Methanoculleus sp.]|nr:hypothetical protein [Methanoculleus sp.]